jgi:hypothetical protein
MFLITPVNNYIKKYIQGMYKKMLNTFSDLLPIFLLSGWILYANEMARISTSILGKLMAILIIVYYSQMDKYYGIIACLLIIAYYYDTYYKSTLETYLENFATVDDFKTQNCKNDVLLNKNRPVNLEMTEHVYPTIRFNGEKCNPCSDTCNFSIIEAQLKADETIKPKTSNDFSLNNLAEKIGDFIPSLWVKSEPFSML